MEKAKYFHRVKKNKNPAVWTIPLSGQKTWWRLQKEEELSRQQSSNGRPPR